MHSTLNSHRIRSNNGEGGFTLVELLVVLAILGLLMAIATPTLLRHLGSAKIQTTHLEMKNIAAALDIFSIENGRYPSQQEGLTALLLAPQGAAGWNGPYISKQNGLIDPWGQAYQYRIPGQHGPYDLYSLGPDGANSGTSEAGHVNNW